MTKLAFIDTETTGLDPDRHGIWEVALIIGEREHVWQFPIHETAADPFALKLNGYWDRHWSTDNISVRPLDALYEAHTTQKSRNTSGWGRAMYPGDDWCRYFQSLTADHHLVGAVPSFDEERLRKLLLSEGVLPRWHYHLVDVEALVAGKLGIEPPWDSNELSRAVDVEPENFHRHEALADARWAKALYEAVMGQNHD